MNRQRITWADNAKALGMLLVYWGHLIETGAFSGYATLNVIYRFIYAFHMPFFFLLAGFFYRPSIERFGALFVNKIKNRLVPVLFFSMLAILLYQKPALWGFPPEVSLQAWQKKYLLLQGKPTENWTSWFLVCLFWVELAASEVIPALTSTARRLLILPASFYLAHIATSNSANTAVYLGTVENWWFLQEATMALFFYLCGYFLSQYGEVLLPSTNRLRSLCIFALSLTVLTLTFSRNFDGSLAAVNMSGAAHGVWYWFLPAALCGSLFMIHAGQYIPANKLIDFIGKNTLPLLGINGFFLVFLNPMLWRWISTHFEGTALVLVTLPIAILSLLASLPLALLMNKFLPFLVGRWK